MLFNIELKVQLGRWGWQFYNAKYESENAFGYVLLSVHNAENIP